MALAVISQALFYLQLSVQLDTPVIKVVERMVMAVVIHPNMERFDVGAIENIRVGRHCKARKKSDQPNLQSAPNDRELWLLSFGDPFAARMKTSDHDCGLCTNRRQIEDQDYQKDSCVLCLVFLKQGEISHASTSAI